MKDISGNDKEKTVNSTPANLISLSTNNLARDKRSCYLQALETLVQLIYIGCTEQKALNTFIL